MFARNSTLRVEHEHATRATTGIGAASTAPLLRSRKEQARSTHMVKA
jgi:hypothetical protein